MEKGLTCGICKKKFPSKYLEGLRDSSHWGDIIICGGCYNKGYENLKEVGE